MLKYNENELFIENLPFDIGIQETPYIEGFPDKLPFALIYDYKNKLIVQKKNPKVNEWLKKAYIHGSCLSVPLDEGTFSKQRSESIIHILKKSLNVDTFENMSFLEIGCNKGYILYLLKQHGAKRCVGIEPGPSALEGSQKYGIEIINDFFNPELIKEKFDVVFTYGVLEHIENPYCFIEGMKECIKEGGIMFNAVPDCEYSLSLGDISILCHEHINYFTTDSLFNMYKRADIIDIKYQNMQQGANDGNLYMQGRVYKNGFRIKEQEDLDKNDDAVFNLYNKLVINNVNKIQDIICSLEREPQKFVLYGARPYFLIFNYIKQPIFIDGDKAKHGKYIQGCNNSIKSPKYLINNNIDKIIVIPIIYDEQIREYIKTKFKIQDDKVISVKEIYKNSQEVTYE